MLRNVLSDRFFRDGLSREDDGLDRGLQGRSPALILWVFLADVLRFWKPAAIEPGKHSRQHLAHLLEQTGLFSVQRGEEVIEVRIAIYEIENGISDLEAGRLNGHTHFVNSARARERDQMRARFHQRVHLAPGLWLEGDVAAVPFLAHETFGCARVGAAEAAFTLALARIPSCRSA
jgi:hypothetical protein